MTGGVAVVLGETGRNFAAGMSGGIAYVLDEHGGFKKLVNTEMVEFEDMSNPDDQQRLFKLVSDHVRYTGSTRGQYVLDNWDRLLSKFVKIMPTDYKRAMAEMKAEKMKLQQPGVLQGVGHG